MGRGKKVDTIEHDQNKPAEHNSGKSKKTQPEQKIKAKQS